MAALTDAGQCRRVNRVPGRAKLLRDPCITPTAVPGAMDEDER